MIPAANQSAAWNLIWRLAQRPLRNVWSRAFEESIFAGDFGDFVGLIYLCKRRETQMWSGKYSTPCMPWFDGHAKGVLSFLRDFSRVILVVGLAQFPAFPFFPTVRSYWERNIKRSALNLRRQQQGNKHRNKECKFKLYYLREFLVSRSTKISNTFPCVMTYDPPKLEPPVVAQRGQNLNLTQTDRGKETRVETCTCRIQVNKCWRIWRNVLPTPALPVTKTVCPAFAKANTLILCPWSQRAVWQGYVFTLNI